MKTPPPIESRPRAREEGIALFVVLVVVIVLTVVITQLSITTKIEERISLQHQGFLESTYSLQAVARRVASTLFDDWTADIEGSSGGETGTDPTDPLGGGGAGAGGAGEEPAESTDPIDARHEEWRHLQEESLNEWQIEIQITDGESKFSLQHIFWYVKLEEDGQNPTENYPTLWMAAMKSPDPEAEDEDAGPGETPAPPADGETPVEEEPEIIREFQIPSEERVEKTKIMVSRLIEAIVDYNTAQGFSYYDSPSPDAAAEAICEWAIDRMREEETRRIRRLEPLKDLPDVGWELFNGPPDPEAEEQEEEDFDPDSGFGGALGQFDDMGSIPGYEDIDEGVQAIPKPLGLRHVLTPYSTGRINLNTARPEIILALLIDIEDYEVAFEIAESINVRLDSYIVDEEDESATDPTTPEDETAQQDFYTFTVVDDIKKIDDDDDEIDWEEQTSTYDGDEKKIWDLILEALRPVATYKSTYFTAHLTGRREDRVVEAELVVARDEQQVKVLSWREIAR